MTPDQNEIRNDEIGGLHLVRVIGEVLRDVVDRLLRAREEMEEPGGVRVC